MLLEACTQFFSRPGLQILLSTSNLVSEAPIKEPLGERGRGQEDSSLVLLHYSLSGEVMEMLPNGSAPNASTHSTPLLNLIEQALKNPI